MAKRLQAKRWSDLSPRQKRLIIAAGVVQNSLLAAALFDLRRRPASKVNGDKRLWAAGAFVSWIGPLSYFAFGRKR
jgi:type II secretory pathway component PulM